MTQPGACTFAVGPTVGGDRDGTTSISEEIR
jgi:hypothetical protein